MRFMAFLYFILFTHRVCDPMSYCSKCLPDLHMVRPSVTVEVYASLIDEFRGAMYNVELGFEKLLSDVVTDMKGTIDCTISAVEHVLYLNGRYKEPSNNSDNCIHSVEARPTYNVKSSDDRKLIGLKNTTILPDIVHQTDHALNKDVISEHLQSSISRVNKTLLNIIDDHETTKKIKTIAETLRNETHRLTEVSNLLRLELEKISKDVKNKFSEINYNDEPSADFILSEIKMLQDIESKSHNSSEVQEVHDVLEETLKELKGNEQDHEDKMDKIIKELEKDLTSKHFDVNFSNIHIDDTVKVFKRSRGRSDETETKNSQSIEKSIFNHQSEGFNNFDHIFNLDENTENKKEVVEQANKIIEESRLADRLFATT